jgi:hypothetical protein
MAHPIAIAPKTIPLVVLPSLKAWMLKTRLEKKPPTIASNQHEIRNRAPKVRLRSFISHLKCQLDCLSRQPFCSKAFVVCMEFWLGLAVRYRLLRRKRVESPSLKFVRNLLLGRPLWLDHLLFPSARVRPGGGWHRAA